ncbi:MAG: hypothetical protein KDA80_05975 [Planctomycetaceae bacterium]|nr:hypothetical protein [Planctomycetaceae bacterium]
MYTESGPFLNLLSSSILRSSEIVGTVIFQIPPVSIPAPQYSSGDDNLFTGLGSMDLVSLILIAVVVHYLGAAVQQMRPDFHHWGIKLGIGAFLLWAGAWLTEHGMNDRWGVAAMLLRGILFGTIACGVVRTLQPIWQRIADLASEARRWQERRERERQRREEEIERRKRQHQADLDWERNAPQREAAARQEEERRQQALVWKRRKEEARAQAMQLFLRHRSTLGEMFTRSDFDEYLKSYMGDSQPVETVERRLQELSELVEQLVERVLPPKKVTTLEEAAEWYQENCRMVERLNLTDRQKRSMLATLSRKHTEMMERILGDMPI